MNTNSFFCDSPSLRSASCLIYINLCYELSAAIFRSYFPWKFAIAICRGNLPWGFCICKQTFFLCEQIFSLWKQTFFIWKQNIFLFMGFFLLTVYLFAYAVAVMDHRRSKIFSMLNLKKHLSYDITFVY